MAKRDLRLCITLPLMSFVCGSAFIAVGCGGSPAPNAIVTAPAAAAPAAPPVKPRAVPSAIADESAKPIAGESPSDSGANAADSAVQADRSETLETRLVSLKGANPFARRLKAPEFPKGLTWINSRPLSKEDLKGKFVLLDFWTYCCINCMHILPELKKLEEAYPNELVVIGVHSAKFDTEKDAENIRAAVLRYEIEHAVVNDSEHQIWNTYGVSSWPTILLIDPEGMAVWGRSGEFKAEEVKAVLDVGIPWYRDEKLLDEKPFVLELEAHGEKETPLRFPGKVLADEKGGRLFISDSNHNRIIITDLNGKLLETIGSGEMGQSDGDYQTASFDHPQGCALHNETLYVADTENHLLRKIDLKAKSVTTIAGTGEQAATAWPGIEVARATGVLPERWVGPPSSTAIASPWALWVHKQDLYIAMAGPHQIWKMPLSETEIGPYSGNGREDIVDGPLLPREPYMARFASFAQPSGLTSDGTWLYVADSEGSSIRAVPFDPKKHVKTVVGSDLLEYGRLFAFGDKDGPRNVAKLQHCLGVTHVKGKLYVADTYNHKIKVVDAKNGATKTLAGTGEAGSTDDPPAFHEPAGISHAKGKLYIADTNNHAIRTLDLATGKVATLTITGLTPPGASPGAPVAAVPKKPSFAGARQEKISQATVKPVDGKATLLVSLKVPRGWKMNPLAPMSYWLDSSQDAGPLDRTAFGRTKLEKPAAEFPVVVPVTGDGDDIATVSLNYYYCEEADEGVCKVGSVVFTVPIKISTDGSDAPVKLTHVIQE